LGRPDPHGRNARDRDAARVDRLALWRHSSLRPRLLLIFIEINYPLLNNPALICRRVAASRSTRSISETIVAVSADFGASQPSVRHVCVRRCSVSEQTFLIRRSRRRLAMIWPVLLSFRKHRPINLDGFYWWRLPARPWIGHSSPPWVAVSADRQAVARAIRGGEKSVYASAIAPISRSPPCQRCELLPNWQRTLEKSAAPAPSSSA
jgi:hypothetical protein